MYKNKIPMLGTPNTREIDRIIEDLERRVMILGRDERTYSGLSAGRIGFILGVMKLKIHTFSKLLE